MKYCIILCKRIVSCYCITLNSSCYLKPLVAWFVTIPFYFLWHQYFTLLCQSICAKLLQKSYLKMNEVFTSHFCFLLWSRQDFFQNVTIWLFNGQNTCIHYLWWTASIKPRLLISHASYASFELFLRLKCNLKLKLFQNFFLHSCKNCC